MFRNSLLFLAVALFSMPAATTTKGIPVKAFQNPSTKAALERIEHNTDRFKAELDKTLDDSVLNGTDVEDRLNQWADLLEDEVDSASKEFNRAGSGNNLDVKAAERFGGHWGNAMMAATAINRAMIRRGFAPEAEKQWTGIRTDMNAVAGTLQRPRLPNMTAVIFRPAPPSTFAHPDVKQVMQDFKESSDRFEDKLEHAWFVAMTAEQRHVTQHWADDLKSATEDLLEEYKDQHAPEFQFKLEESLMLAAGLNRALLLTPVSTAPLAEWELLRSRLNTLAKHYGYPVLPSRLQS